jgi:hypothetical protein
MVSVHIGNGCKAHVDFNSSFRELTPCNLQEGCYGDLPHLGETRPPHSALVLRWNPGFRSPFAGVFVSVYKHRGWLIHKQSIFFPGGRWKQFQRPIIFRRIICRQRYPGGVPLISSTWPAR